MNNYSGGKGGPFAMESTNTNKFTDINNADGQNCFSVSRAADVEVSETEDMNERD